MNAVMYVVIGGDKYLDAAIESAQSVREHSPGLTLCILTGRPGRCGGVFDRIISYPDRPHPDLILRCHIDALLRSPYDRTLLLDSDTYVCGDIEHLFGALDRYDFAAALAPRRYDPGWKSDIPSWFPELNGGVLLARKSSRTTQFLKDWGRLYTQYDKWNDQMALRAALYQNIQHGLRFYTLPPEYNARIMCMTQLGGKAYILHGRKEELSETCSRINEHHGIRVYIPKHGLFKWQEWRERLFS